MDAPPPPVARTPVGAVLAGGRGRRMGAPKATIRLGGRPLLAHAVDVLRGELDRVAVVAKAGTALPPLPAGVERWADCEPGHHPLVGIVTALRRAGGAPVVVVPVDCPLVTRGLVRALAARPAGLAAVADAGDGRVPLVARFEPGALDVLAEHAAAGGRVLDAVLALAPSRVPADPLELLNVNTPADVAAAERALRSRA